MSTNKQSLILALIFLSLLNSFFFHKNLPNLSNVGQRIKLQLNKIILGAHNCFKNKPTNDKDYSSSREVYNVIGFEDFSKFSYWNVF
jgi:hypothetical protein